MGDLWKPSWGGKNWFNIDIDNFAKTPRPRYLSISFNACYLLVPCKTMWRLRLRLRTDMSVPGVNTKIPKRKVWKYIRSEVIKVYQKKRKIRSFIVISVNINVLKMIHRNDTEETNTKLKTEQVWPIQVCMYHKGYSESALQ